ncbi:hypothetical protein AgCh_024078 [Apium graveolens]
MVIAPAVSVPTPQTKERAKLKEKFEDAYERCRTKPLEGVSFNVQDFHLAIQQYDFNSEIGTKDGSLGTSEVEDLFSIAPERLRRSLYEDISMKFLQGTDEVTGLYAKQCLEQRN